MHQCPCSSPTSAQFPTLTLFGHGVPLASLTGILLLSLYLMITLHRIRITRWRTRLITSCVDTRSSHWSSSLAALSPRCTRWLVLRHRRSRHRRIGAVLSLVARSSGRRLVRNVVVCYSRTSNIGFVVGNVLIFVVIFGVFGDYVPCVEEAGKVTEHTEEEVDERVGAAEAGFDPDYARRCQWLA